MQGEPPPSEVFSLAYLPKSRRLLAATIETNLLILEAKAPSFPLLKVRCA